ncbi:hypothetical protein [Amycolatopsis sp. NPDC051371]|uniref:hypothetical protein n=1 Tax=Amycolatopsis sp. NPDC051371 TaxID=3155800 RepID=UPI00341DEBE6
MGYHLQAVISTGPMLRTLASAVESTHVVTLGQHLSMLPMTDALFDAITAGGEACLDGSWKGARRISRALAACSVGDPVAYVKADYFGGCGTHPRRSGTVVR